MKTESPVPDPASRERWLARLTALAVVAAVAWTFRHRLLAPTLFHDDFLFLLSGRSFDHLCQNWLEVHVGHLCPVARVITFVLLKLSSRWVDLNLMSGVTTLLFLAWMLLAFHAMLRAFGCSWRARAVALSLFGVSTVYYNAVDWYSASFAILAAAMTFQAVSLAVRFGQGGSAFALPGMALLSLLAPLTYSTGVLAGPLAALVVLVRRAPWSRKAWTLLFAGTATTLFLVLLLTTQDHYGTLGQSVAALDLKALATTPIKLWRDLIVHHNLRLDSWTNAPGSVLWILPLALAGAAMLLIRGRRDIGLAGFALLLYLGNYLLVAFVRLRVMDYQGILDSDRYHVFGQAALALLAMLTIRGAMRFRVAARDESAWRGQDRLTRALPLLVLLPLLVAHKPPGETCRMIRGYASRTRQLLGFLDDLFPAMRELNVGARTSAFLAFIPVEDGWMNAVHLYGHETDDARLPPETRRAFRARWRELTDRHGLATWSRGPLRIEDMVEREPIWIDPPHPPRTFCDVSHPIECVGCTPLDTRNGLRLRVNAPETHITFRCLPAVIPGRLLYLAIDGTGIPPAAILGIQFLDPHGAPAGGDFRFPLTRFLPDVALDLRRLPWRFAIPVGQVRLTMTGATAGEVTIRLLGLEDVKNSSGV